MLLRQLVARRHLDLSVFKPVDFVADLDEQLKEFLNVFFCHLIGRVSMFLCLSLCSLHFSPVGSLLRFVFRILGGRTTHTSHVFAPTF
jgi:hypothetical protein